MGNLCSITEKTFQKLPIVKSWPNLREKQCTLSANTSNKYNLLLQYIPATAQNGVVNQELFYINSKSILKMVGCSIHYFLDLFTKIKLKKIQGHEEGKPALKWLHLKKEYNYSSLEFLFVGIL